MKKILVIEDSNFFRTSIALALEKAGYEVVGTASGEEGLLLVKREKPDLVLLDVVLPAIDGFEVCRILRDSDSNNLMPIIMLSSLDSQDDKLVGLELGADDYITKPFNERELLSRIKNTLRRIDRNRAANPLTGLPGNIEIQREISSCIVKGIPFAVIYVDLDNFKSYNDVYGFVKGDSVIKLTADILLDETLASGAEMHFVGHIGGDDFVIVTAPQNAPAICEDVIASFNRKIRGMFSRADLDRGYISTLDRRGEIDNFPIMTISMAVVTNEHRHFESHLEVSEVASELKQKLKSMAGSNYMVDRRTQ